MPNPHKKSEPNLGEEVGEDSKSVVSLESEDELAESLVSFRVCLLIHKFLNGRTYPDTKDYVSTQTQQNAQNINLGNCEIKR